MTEYPIFENFIRATNSPEFKKAPRNTCKSDIIKIYQEGRQF